MPDTTGEEDFDEQWHGYMCASTVPVRGGQYGQKLKRLVVLLLRELHSLKQHQRCVPRHMFCPMSLLYIHIDLYIHMLILGGTVATSTWVCIRNIGADLQAPCPTFASLFPY